VPFLSSALNALAVDLRAEQRDVAFMLLNFVYAEQIEERRRSLGF
jgi:hypothetical protein